MKLLERWADFCDRRFERLGECAEIITPRDELRIELVRALLCTTEAKILDSRNSWERGLCPTGRPKHMNSAPAQTKLPNFNDTEIVTCLLRCKSTGTFRLRHPHAKENRSTRYLPAPRHVEAHFSPITPPRPSPLICCTEFYSAYCVLDARGALYSVTCFLDTRRWGSGGGGGVLPCFFYAPFTA